MPFSWPQHQPQPQPYRLQLSWVTPKDVSFNQFLRSLCRPCRSNPSSLSRDGETEALRGAATCSKVDRRTRAELSLECSDACLQSCIIDPDLPAPPADLPESTLWVLTVNCGAGSEPHFRPGRSCLQSCRMHFLLNAAVVTKRTVSQLCMDVTCVTDSSLKSGLTLDLGMEGALCPCQAGLSSPLTLSTSPTPAPGRCFLPQGGIAFT